MAKQNKVVIVLGMHRSGTSLLARWLHTSGVSMGNEFLAASPSNPTGFFEDPDFLDFHIGILREYGLDYDVKATFNSLHGYKKYLPEAQRLFYRKSENCPQWGLKDPRTCLFVDLWREVIPNAYYIILYRNYQEVVESLVRRQKLRHVNGNSYILWQWELWKMYRQRSSIYNHYLQVVNYYNEQILAHSKSIPDHKKLVLTIDLLAMHPTMVRRHLELQWGLNLQKNDMKFRIRDHLFRKASASVHYYDLRELQRAKKIELQFRKLLLNIQ